MGIYTRWLTSLDPFNKVLSLAGRYHERRKRMGSWRTSYGRILSTVVRNWYCSASDRGAGTWMTVTVPTIDDERSSNKTSTRSLTVTSLQYLSSQEQQSQGLTLNLYPTKSREPAAQICLHSTLRYISIKFYISRLFLTPQNATLYRILHQRVPRHKTDYQ